jgi:hypothetical protein
MTRRVAPRTPLHPWHTRVPRAVSGKCGMKRCSPWPTPFSPQTPAEDRSSLFVWFIDTMTQSDSSRACASALWLGTFADRPPSLAGRGALEVSGSRARCFSACAGSRNTQDRFLARIIANNRGAFLHQERVGVLVLRFSKLKESYPAKTPVESTADAGISPRQELRIYGGWLWKPRGPVSEEVKEISWKAHHRLHGRYRKLLGKGKKREPVA